MPGIESGLGSYTTRYIVRARLLHNPGICRARARLLPPYTFQVYSQG